MRILILSPYIPDERIGGSGIKLEYTVRTLSEKHNLTLLSFHPSDLGLPDFPNVRILREPSDYEWGSIPLLKKLNPSVYFTRFYRKHVKDRLLRLEGEHDLTLLDSFFCFQYISFLNKPAVIDLHNFHSELLSKYVKSESSFLKRLYLKAVLSDIRKRESSIIGSDIGKIVTGPLPEYINQPDNICSIIPYPFWLKRTPIPDSIRCRNVLFTANFSWDFNKIALKKIIPIAERFPELDFHIAGKSLYGDFSQKNIHTYPDIMRTEELFDRCGIFLDLSEAGSGINIKLLQALHHKMFIISSADRTERIPGLTKACADYNKRNIDDILSLPDDIMNKTQKEASLLRKRLCKDSSLLAFISAQKI